MLPKVPIVFINTVLVIVILSCCHTSAKPFFNPFNVAIKTEFSENGNTLSFIYPKNSYNVGFKFNSKQINKNQFDFSGLVSALFRKITSKFSAFNPFRFSAMTTTTTTERIIDFSGEVDGGVDSGNHSSTTEDNNVVESSESSNGHESGEVSSNGNDGSTTESIKTGYLPPVSTPASYYIPPN